MSVAEPLRQTRSRTRAVLAHVGWSAAVAPWFVKWVLFVVLSAIGAGLVPALLIWMSGSVAIFVWATRRSLKRLETRYAIDRPESCVLPCVIGFGGLMFFSLLIDVAIANNATRRPGSLLLVSLIVHFGLFAGMSWATQRTFSQLPGARPEGAFQVSRLLVPVGDAVLLVGLITLIVLLNS